jgi:hypothetical protein
MAVDIWADWNPSFTPGGTEEFEDDAWRRRETRIAAGWDEHDATAAYEDEMANEGYSPEREAEIG